MSFCSVSASTRRTQKEYIQSQLHSKSITFSAVWLFNMDSKKFPGSPSLLPGLPLWLPGDTHLAHSSPRYRASAYSQVFGPTLSQEACTPVGCLFGAPEDCDRSSPSGKISHVCLKVQVIWIKWTDFI